MTTLVKITHDEDGEKIQSPKWCYSHDSGGCHAALCTGQVYGYGVGAAKYDTKIVERGGITCPDCLRIIKEIKAIKL